MNIAAIYPITPLYGDPNVSLITDDEVLFAYEEEKLTRRQRGAAGRGYPAIALHEALKKAELRPDQVDLWALVGTTHDVMGDFVNLLRNTGINHFVPDLKINRVPHHTAHAALAVFTAPFDECLYVLMDHGGGNQYTAAVGVFRHQHFQEIHRSSGLHLSHLRSDMARHLGFERSEEEKLAGLAAYGRVDRALYRHLTSILRLSEEGRGVAYGQAGQRGSSFLDGGLTLFTTGDPRFEFSSIPRIQEFSNPDIAATVQKLMEDHVVELVSAHMKKTGIRQVALCGSFFENSRLNGIVQEAVGAGRVHVPMATGDAGLSLGGALYTLWEHSGRRPLPASPYLGPVFDNRTIEEEIRVFGLKHRHSSSVSKEAARFIAQSKVVGWFQGAGEYGPRSLGARSVLADPRDPHAKERMDRLLKNPHWFVPCGCSILEEHMHEFFDHACESPYTNIIFKTREDKARLIPAAVHVDGTSIPHTVGKMQNRRYYELLEEFKRLTGLPMVLNAGFNRFGTPAVCTPRQALEHLCMGCVDILVIGDYVVEREFLPREEPVAGPAEPQRM